MPADIFQPHKSESLRDKVYDTLRDAILSGALAPGERLVERDISARMNISTTPVKEALRRLEQDGLILAQPRRGAVVSDMALTSLTEIIAIRAALESLAAQFAAEKMPPDEQARLAALLTRMQALTDAGSPAELFDANTAFHDLIREAGRNRLINQMLELLRPFDDSVRRQALADREEAQRGLTEHQAICEAIFRRDGPSAKAQMQAHILRTLRFVVDQAHEKHHTREAAV